MTLGPIVYHITPEATRYVPGFCQVYVWEQEDPAIDNTGPVQCFLRANATDHSGNLMAGHIDGNTFSATYQSMNLSGLMQNDIIITPESLGDPADYIQFTAGTDSWVSSNADRCKTNPWSTPDVGDRDRVSTNLSSYELRKLVLIIASIFSFAI
jgi:hypothetical protein